MYAKCKERRRLLCMNNKITFIGNADESNKISINALPNLRPRWQTRALPFINLSL